MNQELNINDIKANAEMDANSYISKDEFISMVQTMEFTHIKNAKIFFITGFKHNVEKDETDAIGYCLDIKRNTDYY